MTHESPVGASVEWYTPPAFFRELQMNLGIELEFDLDPASPPSGPVPWVPAQRFYSPMQNGLLQEWKGRVWLNPPYGPTGVAFIQKMVAHGNGMLLIPARTETRIFQHAADNAQAVCFLRDRVHFVREDGYQARSGFASALLGYGSDCASTVDAADMGWTVRARRPSMFWEAA